MLFKGYHLNSPCIFTNIFQYIKVIFCLKLECCVFPETCSFVPWTFPFNFLYFDRIKYSNFICTENKFFEKKYKFIGEMKVRRAYLLFKVFDMNSRCFPEIEIWGYGVGQGDKPYESFIYWHRKLIRRVNIEKRKQYLQSLTFWPIGNLCLPLMKI